MSHLYAGYVIETVRHISLLATYSGIVKVMVDEHIASEHDGSDREEKTNIVFEITVNAKLTEIAALDRRSARASQHSRERSVASSQDERRAF